MTQVSKQTFFHLLLKRGKKTYVILHILNFNSSPLPHHIQLYLKSLSIKTDSFLNIPLFPFDVC